MKADVKLAWRNVEVPAEVMTPLGYSYWVEGLGEDEADKEQYCELTARFGEPNWDLMSLHERACRQAGIGVRHPFPPHLDARDFGGATRDAFSFFAD